MTNKRRIFQSNLKQLMLDRSARDGQPLTQEEVARATNLSYPTINRWYHGQAFERIEASTVIALMDYFRCELSDLVKVDCS